LAFITISFTVLKTIFQGALCCKRESRRDGRQYSAISTIEAQVTNEMSNPGFDTDAIGTNANSSIFTNRVFDLLVGCVQANPNLRATFTFPPNGVPTVDLTSTNQMRPICNDEASAPPNYSDVVCTMPRN